jgi:uncharacterized protein DUF6653
VVVAIVIGDVGRRATPRQSERSTRERDRWARRGGIDMAMDAGVATAFGLELDAWQRHANPRSVYTRIPIPPLLVAAIRGLTRIG